MEYRLEEIATYSNKKIEVKKLNLDNYVSTENMLPNRLGITKATVLPNQDKVCFFKENNILISNIRPYFKKIWLANCNGGCSNDVLNIIVTDREKVLPKYLYYILFQDNFFDYVMTGNKGTKMPRGDKNHIMKYVVNIPKIEIQNKIINILEKIGKKIYVNNQINDNLHKLADALFKAWFIDFNFPGFNGKLKETKLGLIPEDWKIEKLEDIADCQNGYAFYKDGYDDNGLMVIDLGNVNLNGTFIYTNADKYVQQERVNTDKFEKYKVYKNDLIMVMTDRKATMELLGKTGKIYENKKFLLNQRMYRIRSKINTNYLYTALNNDIILSKLKAKALGSVQKYINTGHINELELIIGTEEIMNMFSNIVDPIYSDIENRTIENTRLEQLRDTLLPKLMNGEVDISKIEEDIK